VGEHEGLASKMGRTLGTDIQALSRKQSSRDRIRSRVREQRSPTITCWWLRHARPAYRFALIRRNALVFARGLVRELDRPATCREARRKRHEHVAPLEGRNHRGFLLAAEPLDPEGSAGNPTSDTDKAHAMTSGR
jgi:hypothetical protein